MFESFTM